MDGLFRLFCGCCGNQSGENDPPYAQLRDDSVTPIRDPPIQQTHRQPANGSAALPQPDPQLLMHQQQGFVNPVHDFYSNFDAPDGANLYPTHQYHGVHSNSSSPHTADMEIEVEDENREREQLDNIVESTQHSIIAVGQTDVDGVIMMDTHHREKAYKMKTAKMATAQPSVTSYETTYEFELDSSQTPIQVPLRYDEMSSTIEATPTERMPFSCPDFNQLKLARTMGAKNPQFLVEHPDLKRAGRSPGINTSMKAKVTEVLDEVHKGVVAVEVEPRDLIVSMDF